MRMSEWRLDRYHPCVTEMTELESVLFVMICIAVESRLEWEEPIS